MTNMDCKTCKDLLWEHLDNELNNDLTQQVDEHLANCPACRTELTSLAETTRFLKEHMPVLILDNSFVQATMNKIGLAESGGAFLKPIIGIGLALTGLIIVTLVIISPFFFSLLWLIGNIIFTLVRLGTLVVKTTPLLQIISGVALSTLLFIVLASIRRLAIRRIA
ncbi:putative zinc finger protein [Anaerospora hongkongensis]|uniref:Anti-sigma-W factor RsiW n=2 Tax=Anaerospora hongkongensis TaxID=244830 RepID=A0A4R1PX70_9FIRM|nr:putative zinc finger protein [Anaerospora hongkongensis]